jgi:putative Mg2+ transporter-C (MgtC) family protein
MLEIFWSELNSGFSDTTQMPRVVIRLIAAMVLGGIIGIQREQTGKPAGLRTHILVALGSTLFVLAATGVGMNADGISRVIQGLAAGIGFLGAGAILKLSEKEEIHGLTTAAGIWMTAAIGVAVGVGALGLALVSTVLAWMVLASIRLYENRVKARDESQGKA